MKKALLFLLTLFSLLPVLATTKVTFGDFDIAEKRDHLPCALYYNRSGSTILYTPEDLGGAAGTLKAISFYVDGSYDYYSTKIRIFVSMSASASVPQSYGSLSSWTSGMTEVFSGDYTFSNGENVFMLSKSIEYDGKSTLKVCVVADTDNTRYGGYFLCQNEDVDWSLPLCSVFSSYDNSATKFYPDVVGMRPITSFTFVSNEGEVTFSGTSTGMNGDVPCRFDHEARTGSMTLYKASELNDTAGDILALSYSGKYNDEFASTHDYKFVSNVRIFMSMTSEEEVTTDYGNWNDWVSGMTEVYSGRHTLVNGENVFALNAPFTYDGKSNLKVFFLSDRDDVSYAFPGPYYYFNSSYDYDTDRDHSLCATFGTYATCLSSYRPVTTFVMDVKIDPTAPVLVEVGNGTNTNNFPFASDYYSTTQILYPASEIEKAGKITSLAFNAYNATYNSYKSKVNIYLAHKSATRFSSSSDYVPFDDLTLVYSGERILSAGSGWDTFEFDKPFDYDGVSSLVVVVTRSVSGSSSCSSYYNKTTSHYSMLYRSSYSSSSYADPSSYRGGYSTSYYRPNIRLYFQPDYVALYGSGEEPDVYPVKGSNAIPAIDIHDGSVEEYVNTCDGARVNAFSYSRTFADASWQPLYLPFALNVASLPHGCEVSYISNVHEYDTDGDGRADTMDLEAFRVKGGTLRPAYPYLVRSAAGEDLRLSLSDAVLHSSQSGESISCRSTRTQYTFQGTFRTLDAAALQDLGAYIVDDGALRKADDDDALGAFRWYMVPQSRTGQPVDISRIRIHVVDNEVDALSAPYGLSTGEGAIYDLSGRVYPERLSKDRPSAPGCYIRDNKKYIKQ